jgi:hypothetical protein
MDKERYIRRFETVLDYFRYVSKGQTPRGRLFDRELELFIHEVKQLNSFLKKNHSTNHIEAFIDSMEDIEYEPHHETAQTLYDKCGHFYNLHIVQTITNEDILSRHKKDFDFEEVRHRFQLLTDAYQDDFERDLHYIPRRLRRPCYEKWYLEGQLYRFNRKLFEKLTSYLHVSFFVVDDINKTSQIVKSIFRHLDETLPVNSNINLNEVFARLSHLPKPIIEGFCYNLFQSGSIAETLYYKLVLSIVSNDYGSFSNVVLDNNLSPVFSKYCELIELADELSSSLNERKFDPESYIKLIDVYFDRIKPTSDTVGSDTRGLCIPIVGVVNEIKDDDIILQENYNKLNIDDSERYIQYKRFCQIKFDLNSNISGRMLSGSSAEMDDSNLLPVDAEGNHQTKISNEVELDCKFQDKIDEFIDYLVWRGYIADENKQSFKYDAFGGLKPDNYTALSFNLDKKNAKTILGVILWLLRKNRPSSNVNIFGTSVSQSNKYIGPSKDSQRVYVDICLFFPSLIKSLTIKKEENENSILKARLIKRVEDLLAKEEYQKLSVLECIKWLECNDIQYWVVSRNNTQEKVE